METYVAVTRDEIVRTARRYLGFPLRHQGRIAAFDCVGLVLAVAEDLGLTDVRGLPIRRNDYAHYSRQPVDGFVHQECSRRLLVAADGGLTDLSLKAKRLIIRAGDVLTLRVPTIACHVAIASDLNGETGIIHAYIGSEKVVEHRLDDRWARRVVGIFSFPGID